MQYTFTIIAAHRVITSLVDVQFDLTGCPFGANPYRVNGSSTASAANLDAFWNTIDKILTQNGLTSTDFKRAVKAEGPSGSFGDTTADLTRLV